MTQLAPPPNEHLEKLKEEILGRKSLILGICRKLLDAAGEIDMAGAIANQVSMEAIKSSGGFRGEANLDTWLAVITRNTVNKYLRKKIPEKQKTIAIGKQDFEDRNPNIEEALIKQEELEMLRKAIDKLPDNQKNVIQMSLEGMTAKEIAEKIGVSLSAVESIIFRAREKLAKLMG